MARFTKREIQKFIKADGISVTAAEQLRLFYAYCLERRRCHGSNPCLTPTWGMRSSAPPIISPLSWRHRPKKFCVRTKTLSKKGAKSDFFKTKLSHFFTAVMVALCTTFSADSRVLQKAQKKFRNPQISELFWSECRDSNSRPLEPHSSAIPNFATPGYHIHLLHHVSLITIPHSFLFCKPYFRFFCIFYGSGSRSPAAPPPTPAGYPGTGPHPVLCR